NTDFKTALTRKQEVILKLLPFQQNGNELTVPSPLMFPKEVLIGHSVH
ncbi:hypothetical protein DET48_13344, partial [Vibrio diazotrophicus]